LRPRRGEAIRLLQYDGQEFRLTTERLGWSRHSWIAGPYASAVVWLSVDPN
jgi:hypothetical protein